ncbi:Coiled-coil domain-containing protein 39, partial [Gonapodya sp. JEL0774]
MLSFDESDDILSLPPFANEENRKLADLIRQKQQELNAVVAELDDNTNRGDAMLSHMRNVQQEIDLSQHLFEARSREIETENHMRQIADREAGRLASDIRRMEKEMAQGAEQLATLQAQIHTTTERISHHRASLHLDSDNLSAWIATTKEKQADLLALQQYTQADAARVKDLLRDIDRAADSVNRVRSRLETEVTETQATQLELDRATDSFLAMHAERASLLAKWEDAVRTMRERDEHIDRTRNEYAQVMGD